MSKKAYVFPGQGSQFVGMAREFAETQAELFEQADAALGYSISRIMLEGPEEELTKTSNSQPALVLASYAQYKEQGSVPAEYVAGHSLGEYSALVAAQALGFEDAIKLVHKRGLLMEEAVAHISGGMLAVLGMSDADVSQVSRELGGDIYVANYNSPGQVVLSGEAQQIEKAAKIFQDKGAKRTVVLNVAGPFHSPLMKDAAEKFANEIEHITISTPKCKYITNVTADYVEDPQELKQLLVKQIYSPVRWVEVVTRLCQDGVDEFEEIGPGKVLTGLIKKIKREL